MFSCWFSPALFSESFYHISVFAGKKPQRKKKLFSDLIVSKINDANKRVMKRRICACVLFPQLKEKKNQSEANELKAKRAPIHISLSVCFRRIAVSQSSNTNFILSFVFVFTLFLAPFPRYFGCGVVGVVVIISFSVCNFFLFVII